MDRPDPTPAGRGAWGWTPQVDLATALAEIDAGLRERVEGAVVSERNVLGGELEPCGTEPMTGFFRDGCCHTGGSEQVDAHDLRGR